MKRLTLAASVLLAGVVAARADEAEAWSQTEKAAGLIEEAKKAGELSKEEKKLRPMAKERPLTSEIPLMRERLRAQGVDPDTIRWTIGVYEPFTGDPGAAGHDSAVAAVIGDPDEGLIHGAAIAMHNPATALLSLTDYKDKYQGAEAGLKRYIEDWAALSFNATTGDFKRFYLDGGNASLRIVNVSFGSSYIFAYRDLYFELQKDHYYANILIDEERANSWSKTVDEAREEFRQSKAAKFAGLEGSLDLGSKSAARHDLYQAIARYVDRVLDGSDAFREALARYQETTERAAKKGVIIVVSAGNEGLGIERKPGQPRYDLRPGAAYNWYAMSGSVIGVGASDIGGTPGERGDDSVCDFSSRGTHAYRPTVVAQGAHMSLRKHKFGRVQGTSFAAPQVSAAIALMLEQNPALGFADVKRLLEENAEPLKDSPPEAQGAGALNIEKAVAAAHASSGRR